MLYTLRRTTRSFFPRECCSKNISNKDYHDSYTSMRSHLCGELRASHIGENVTLCGWLHKLRLVSKRGPLFAPLKDHTGVIQLIVTKDKALLTQLSQLPTESVVSISGQVQSRPKQDINTDMLTGDVEVLINSVNVLNEADKDLPFSTADLSVPAGHELQMEYRPLHLRKSSMQNIIRLRSKIAMATRTYLDTIHGFVDIETPTLFKRTPEGAREFIVPTRTPGQFYSLTQSPQQFKQLLMVGGFDRYYQFAHCYRDEDMKSDRQPEFTQVDLEMAFITQEDIIALIEGLVSHIFTTTLPSYPQPSIPFPRLTHSEALEKYNSDKPKIGDKGFNFLWVTDFPLFTKCPTTGVLESSHHPFTAPHPEDKSVISTNPEKVRGLHYDLVCNGVEIGGGSIRIHDAALQEYILSDILKVDNVNTFSHLLKGLRMGCPPHGGIALGFDRLVAVLCGGIPLTDTIAFPKSARGYDMMCKAPSSLSQDVLDTYHVTVKDKNT